MPVIARSVVRPSTSISPRSHPADLGADWNRRAELQLRVQVIFERGISDPAAHFLIGPGRGAYESTRQEMPYRSPSLGLSAGGIA